MHWLTFITAIYGDVRGYHRLQIWREAYDNQNLSRDELDTLTHQLLQRRIRSALDRFPSYASFVEKHRGTLPTASELINLAELPIWTRKDQRAFFDQQQRPDDSAYIHQTSGSTSLPVRFHVTRESYEWRTAVTDRSYSWAGAQEGARSFYIWAGAVKPPPMLQKIKRRVHTTLQRRTFFEAFQSFGDTERRACCALINRSRPRSIVGYSSLLVDLARFVRDHPGVLQWKPRTMVSAAEGLSPADRALLEEHLVHQVYLSYGSREVMNIGIECERHDGYHLVTDNVLTEVVDEAGRAVAPGEAGRIVITDLRNLATPLIRYEIGDFGTMAAHDDTCACGRPFPRLLSVDGRLQDVVYTPDGGKLTALFITYTMRQFDWIEGYQIVQDAYDKILVRLLTKSDLTPERTGPVETLLRKRLGHDMTINFERADELIRLASGKIHLVISNVEKSAGQ